jgi:hypothetical protein
MEEFVTLFYLKSSRLLLIFTLGPLTFTLLVNIFAYILYSLIDGQKRGFFKYLIGVQFIIMGTLLVLEIGGTMIAVGKILFKILSNKLMRQTTSALDIIRYSVPILILTKFSLLPM